MPVVAVRVISSRMSAASGDFRPRHHLAGSGRLKNNDAFPPLLHKARVSAFPPVIVVDIQAKNTAPGYVRRSEDRLSEPQFRRLGSTLNQLVPMDWAGRTAGFAPSVVYHHSPANRLVKSRPDRGGFTICPCFSEGLSFSADDFDDGGPVLLQD